MTAGRELDALVAEKIMQTEKYWAVMFAGSHYGNFPTLEAANKQAEKIRNGQTIWNVHVIQYYEEPSYSTDIKAAWEVVEKLTDTDGPYGPQKWSFSLEYSSIIDWVCDFTPRARHDKARAYPAFQASAGTPPLAICLAALKAVGA